VERLCLQVTSDGDRCLIRKKKKGCKCFSRPKKKKKRKKEAEQIHKKEDA
jgi:hypothetical protein